MQKYIDAAFSSRPVMPLKGATVTVTTSNGDLATLYSDNAGTLMGNPIYTDDGGNYSFYAADGRYTITIKKTGFQTQVLADVLLEDPSDQVADLAALQLADYAALRQYAGPRQSVYVTGYLGTVNPSGIAGMFVRDDSDLSTADNGGTVIVSSNSKRWKRCFDGKANPKWFGAKFDGTTDDTSAIQTTITQHSYTVIPYGVGIADQITIPSNRVIELIGTLKRKANADSDSFMITNASGASGDNNIVIFGTGELDGNSISQTGDRQGLIKFQKPTDCKIDIGKAGNNKYGTSNPVLEGAGCIVLTDATRCHVRVRLLNLWQREGIYVCFASTRCSVSGVSALGDGLNSWSAVSTSGVGASYNEIFDIDAENCGASSVVCDSTYSHVYGIKSRNNQFGNGVNFGHTGKPATGSRAWGIYVENAGQGASTGTHCGIQVGGATTDMDMSNITVKGAYSHCLQVSDSATRFQLGGKNHLSGALHGSGFNSFGADQVRIDGTTSTGNSDYGVNFNAGNDCSVDDSDLRGNTIGPFSSSGSRVTVRNTPLSSDAMVGSVNLAGLAAGGSTTVSNANVAAFSTAINIFPRSSTAAAGLPFVSNKTSTGFTVTVVNAVSASGGPYNVSYEII